MRQLPCYFTTLNSVENVRVPSGSLPRPGYGPLPANGRPATTLSRSRSTLLDTLRAQTTPTTIAALAAITGLHVNTIREHLDDLARQGLVRRHPKAPTGRGRPAWLYEATGQQDSHDGSEYASLAAVLAEAITRSSDSPVDDAVAAGRGWGHKLSQERGAEPAASAVGARREVVGLLDDLGFAPRADARSAVVHLTRCPLLEAAHRYPDVVCGVHLGLTQAALAEYGADPEGADLQPFAEPGACRLQLNRRAR